MLSHALKQPFVLATGVAAFIHSTWSLATLFSGHQPAYPDGLTIGYLATLAYWLLPAMLIAFAIDLGMVSTSAQIRAGKRTWAKLFTFAILALSTYMLQLNYILAHMPAIPLAEGVRESWLPVAGFIRDSSLFVIPAFLPLASLLYTLDDSQAQLAQTPSTSQAIVPFAAHNSADFEDSFLRVVDPTKGAIVSDFEGIVEDSDGGFVASCPDCDWPKPTLHRIRRNRLYLLTNVYTRMGLNSLSLSGAMVTGIIEGGLGGASEHPLRATILAAMLHRDCKNLIVTICT